MSRLAPNLFERRYGDLVRIGRSRLPSLAPAWTDHNAHDPGITLVELLAWVAEAQLYSLSRTRRDERNAYAALMGIAPHGARPASGLIWPDPHDADRPGMTVQRSVVLDADATVRMAKADTPVFVPTHRLLLVPARIEALESRLADGTRVDHRTANRRGGPAFQPFGAGDGRGAVLRMRLATSGWAPLFEPGRPEDARLVLGVRADRPRVGGVKPIPRAGAATETPLEVVLDTRDGRFPLAILKDTTRGLLRTGAIMLDLRRVEGTPHEATLEFRAPAGFDRAPRILRIEPNVLPVIQRRRVEETHDGNGLPDQQFDLETPGLEFEPGSEPVEIEVEAPSGETATWKQVDRLADQGPDDSVFTLDPAAARVAFGNGVNGAIPPPESRIVARYSVCDGVSGNLAANRKWTVKGLGGTFGVNPDPFGGGEDPSGWLEQRREARRALREEHPLVSAADFEQAARALPGLEVGRAWMMPSSEDDAATAAMRLVVLQARPPGGEPQTAPETRRWLEAVRRELAPRIPLGFRLEVVAPAYVGFAIRTCVTPEPKQDPAAVKSRIEAELVRRLTAVSSTPGVPQRPFGLAVTRRDLAAWIQALPEVRRVDELTIVLDDRSTPERVDLPVRGLPRVDLDRSDISVVRAGNGEMM